MNWNSLLREKAEFIPVLDDEEDTSYFDSKFIGFFIGFYRENNVVCGYKLSTLNYRDCEVINPFGELSLLSIP